MRLALVLLALLLPAAPAYADVEYSVTDLSATGQPTLDAWGVNDAGVVVGQMNTGSPYSGYRWTAELGVRPLEGKDAIGRDVNAHGVAAGSYWRSQDVGIFTTAGSWDVFGTVSARLPAPDDDCTRPDGDPDDCDGAYARGIGDDGVVVGASTINGGQGADHAPAYWLPSATRGIRLQNSVGRLEARNATGVMVGQDGSRAAVWRSPGDKVQLPFLTDGQGQTGDVAFARDVNDAGVVVGDGATRPAGSRFRAFSWTEGGGLRRLDTLGFGSEAHAISERGEIVGMSRAVDQTDARRAVRWVDGVITDLNSLIPPDSGWTLLEAHDVNENGWIVGRGLKDGQQRAFLLRPAQALQVKLEGIGANPFDDTFAIRATITNVGTVPITDLRMTRDLTPTVAPYAPGAGAIAVRLQGPSPALPAALAPGEQAQIAWLEQADTPGYIFYSARFAGTVRGLEQDIGSGVEVRVGEPGPLTLADLAVLFVGGFQEVTGAVQARMDALRRALADHIAKLRPLGKKKSKIKPSAREKALARALGMPENALAAAPDSLKETTGLVTHLIVQRERAKYDALKEEFGGARAQLEAGARFLERWTTDDGIAEITATATEFYRMGREGELSAGYVGDAAEFLNENATSESKRAETHRRLVKLTDDAVKGTTALYDKSLVDGKRRMTRFADDLSRDPKQALGELVYDSTKIESKAGIEYGKSMLGDKAFKSVGLLRRVEKTHDGVDDVVEAFDDERRVANMLDDGPAPPLTAAQAEAATGMTAAMNQRMLDHVTTIQKRYPSVDLRVSVRPLGKGDLAKLKAGLTPKIEAIPIKKLNDVDVKYLGATGPVDEVGYFTPKKPPSKVLNAMSKDDRTAVLERYEVRRMEALAMSGKKIKDPVLAKKVGEMRKALGKDGHTFTESINGRVVRTTELKLGTVKKGNVTLLKNEGLTINGRPVGTRGKGFTGDLDIDATMDGARNLSAGVRGSIELSLQEALRSDPLLPFGFHGWRGFDLDGSDLNKMLIISERISRLPRDKALAEAARYAPLLGCKPEDLLRVRRNGFVVTFTRQGIEVDP